jgi:hypothetical protein
MPSAMVWVNQLGQLQRACLALCLFGGHTYREAAALLGVAPSTAAALLTSGLTDIGRPAASEPILDCRPADLHHRRNGTSHERTRLDQAEESA